MKYIAYYVNQIQLKLPQIKYSKYFGQSKNDLLLSGMWLAVA